MISATELISNSHVSSSHLVAGRAFPTSSPYAHPTFLRLSVALGEREISGAVPLGDLFARGDVAQHSGLSPGELEEPPSMPFRSHRRC